MVVTELISTASVLHFKLSALGRSRRDRQRSLDMQKVPASSNECGVLGSNEPRLARITHVACTCSFRLVITDRLAGRGSDWLSARGTVQRTQLGAAVAASPIPSAARVGERMLAAQSHSPCLWCQIRSSLCCSFTTRKIHNHLTRTLPARTRPVSH